VYYSTLNEEKMIEGTLLKNYRLNPDNKHSLRYVSKTLSIDAGFLSRIENNLEKCSEDVRFKLLSFYKIENQTHVDNLVKRRQKIKDQIKEEKIINILDNIY
jgi:hypothetical protein